MNTICYLAYIEARQLFTERRLAAAEVLVEVPPDPVTALITKSGEDPTSIDEARQRRYSDEVAQEAVLEYARTEIPVTSTDCYDFRIDPVSNPQLITSRVAPTSVAAGCKLWLLKKHEFPEKA